MSRQKDKGTKWETAVVNYLREELGFYAPDIAARILRQPLTGATDLGDIAGIPDFTISCKNHKTTRLSEWIDEVTLQATNGRRTFPVVWHHRPGYSHPKDAYVTMTGGAFVPLLGSRLSDTNVIHE